MSLIRAQLPVRLTPLVGRESELNDIVQAVTRARLQLGNALHTALRELRRAVGDPGWVVYANGHYRFDRVRQHECDVTEFEDALLAARRARPAEAALPHLQRAIGVYGGDFLDGMSAGEWALVRRDELRRAFESALLATGRLQTAAGRHQAAVTVFRRAVAHEPLNDARRNGTR